VEASHENAIRIRETGASHGDAAPDVAEVDQDTPTGQAQRDRLSAAIAKQRSHFLFLGQEIGFDYSNSGIVVPDGTQHYVEEHGVEDPIDIHIETRVNGEIRQDARTNDFVHSIPRCISYVSRYMRLDPGDVILTGSPAGVGFFQGVFLKAGDVVEMTADRIGTLRNSIIDA
jgi:2-keto-4-pentenoate hydratase/2-oxohepta-3-ene-1,7-dioic acid hydratase in catechol pathway